MQASACEWLQQRVLQWTGACGRWWRSPSCGRRHTTSTTPGIARSPPTRSRSWSSTSCSVSACHAAWPSARAGSDVPCVAGGTQPAILPRACEAGGAGGAGAGSGAGRNRQSLAELFLHMLRYYAEFPYDSMAVSVRAGARVPVADCRAARAHKNDPHQWKLLCVEGEPSPDGAQPRARPV